MSDLDDFYRAVRQSQTDIKDRLAIARTRADQRAVDFFTGQLVAYRLILGEPTDQAKAG